MRSNQVLDVFLIVVLSIIVLVALVRAFNDKDQL